jgi:hypothetical protein
VNGEPGVLIDIPGINGVNGGDWRGTTGDQRGVANLTGGDGGNQ